MAEYPAHVSPALPPLVSPAEKPQGFRLDHDHHIAPLNGAPQAERAGVPPLITPSFTPPLTPNGTHTDLTTIAISPPAGSAVARRAEPSSHDAQAKLVEQLPEVWCEVRARIPTTTGQEMFLHLYHNSVDNKEHLAIVFGPHIRSRSLDAPRDGETERDRMIRGAYTGTLFPGRTSSRVDAIRREAGVKPRESISAGGQLNGIVHAAESGSSEESSPSAHSARQASEDEVAHKAESFHDFRSELGPPLVRIHSECYTGETVWSARCDCGEQLDEAARLMSALETDPDAVIASIASPEGARSGTITTAPPGDAETTNGTHHHQYHHHSPFDGKPSMGGAIIYLRQEGRGIGLLSKLKAYNLQDLGADTMQANLLLRHPADARSYGLATAMLLDLGLGGERGIRLLTNNPDKVRAVEGPNREVSVVERVPMIPLAWRTEGKEGVRGKEVEKYISTKIEKFKHMFSE